MSTILGETTWVTQAQTVCLCSFKCGRKEKGTGRKAENEVIPSAG